MKLIIIIALLATAGCSTTPRETWAEQKIREHREHVAAWTRDCIADLQYREPELTAEARQWICSPSSSSGSGAVYVPTQTININSAPRTRPVNNAPFTLCYTTTSGVVICN